ncbi:hypothetical protein GCM10027217_25110 [Pseudomaricurvus hydrocarbonicus]
MLSLVTLLMVGVLYLWFADFSRFKPKIETVISDATGREFRINGDFKLNVLPTPTVLIENASLASPPWGSEPSMLKAGKAYVEIDLLSLLRQPIIVRKLILDDVHALYETNPEGETNWDIAKPSEDKPEPENDTTQPTLKMPVEIQAAALHNIQLLYRQPDSEDFKVLLKSLDITESEPGLWLLQALGQLQGPGQWSDLPITLTAKVTNSHTDLEVTAKDVVLASSYDYPEDSLDFSATVTTLDKLGQLFEVEELPEEDLKLQGNIKLIQDQVELKNVQVGLGGTRLTLNGQLDSADSSVRISTEVAGNLLSDLKPGLPAMPFELQADISASAKSVDLNPFNLVVGDSNLKGTARLESGDVPLVKLEAQSTLIDLSPLTDTPDDSPSAQAPNSSAPKQSASAKKSRYVFDETPIDFEALNSMQVDIKTSIDRLIVSEKSGVETKHVLLQAKTQNQSLVIDNSFEGKVSGIFESHVKITPAGEQSTLALKAHAKDFKLSTLSGPDVPSDQIPKTAIDVDLHTSGATPRALASSLDGTMMIDQGAGRVSNDLIEKFSGDILAQLLNALNPFAKEEEFTNWECSVLAIDFDSGRGEINGFLLQSEKLMVVGGGEVDLNDEKLNFEFNTKPRKGVGVSADMFVTPFVKLSGTLAQPSVGLNTKGLLLSGGAAFLTGGMSFLYTGLMDRATAEADQCAKARKTINSATEASAPQ